MSDNMKKIAIVIPSFNEETNLEIMVKTLHEVLRNTNYDYSILFVDDGSTDKSFDKLEQLSKTDNRLFFAALSRNFGHQNALKAGVDLIKDNADAIITMDGDMQHPPALIVDLLKKWEEGFDVVYTIRDEDKNLSFFKNKTSKMFYWLMNKLSEVEFEPGTADFRLMDKKVAKVFSNFSENELFIRGIVNWVGFKQFAINYQPHERFSGKSKYTVSKMFRFALQGITSFSTKPLHIAIFIGLATTFIALISFILYVLYSLYFGHVISGWTSLISTVVFFGGLNLVVLGIIGIYIGKLFTQSKGRPNYIINKTNFIK
jgi:polyisoprenyl-phosphate glycosyltransferase